jgi:hypothetical protein
MEQDIRPDQIAPDPQKAWRESTRKARAYDQEQCEKMEAWFNDPRSGFANKPKEQWPNEQRSGDAHHVGAMTSDQITQDENVEA